MKHLTNVELETIACRLRACAADDLEAGKGKQVNGLNDGESLARRIEFTPRTTRATADTGALRKIYLGIRNLQI